MIRRAREEELDTVQAGYWLQTLTTISAWTAPSVVAVVTFATYILMDPNNVLDAEKAFVSLSFINSLNWILFIMPNAVYYLGQAIVSFRRVDRFLKQDELEPDAVQREYTPGTNMTTKQSFKCSRSSIISLHSPSNAVTKFQISYSWRHIMLVGRDWPNIWYEITTTSTCCKIVKRRAIQFYRAHLSYNFVMDSSMASQLNVTLIYKIRGSLICFAYPFDMLSMAVCTAKHWCRN